MVPWVVLDVLDLDVALARFVLVQSAGRSIRGDGDKDTGGAPERRSASDGLLKARSGCDRAAFAAVPANDNKLRRRRVAAGSKDRGRLVSMEIMMVVIENWASSNMEAILALFTSSCRQGMLGDIIKALRNRAFSWKRRFIMLL